MRCMPAKYDETQAFVQAYHADLVDDDNEFSNLPEIDDMTIVHDGSQEDAPEEQEVISAADIRKRLRMAAEEGMVSES